MNKDSQFNQILRQVIRANKQHNFIYLNNPKAACGTVKLNLWVNIRKSDPKQVIRTLHNVKVSPFNNQISTLDWAGQARVLTFVRNPLTRVVSSYMDKIAVPGKRVRREFDARYGIRDARDVSFDEFVGLICDDAPDQLDHHWRPQHINVLEGFVTPNFVGTLEAISQDLPRALAHVLGEKIKTIEASQRHKTSAITSYRDMLGNREIFRKLCKLYTRDFDGYGYTPEISAPTQSDNTAAWTDTLHPKLVKLAK